MAHTELIVLQHAPFWHGSGAHAALAYHVPEHAKAVVLVHAPEMEQHAPVLAQGVGEHGAAAYQTPVQLAIVVVPHPPVTEQHAPVEGQRSSAQACAGKKVPEQFAADVAMAHPLAVQHAPWVLGQGSGRQGVLAAKEEPFGQSDLEIKAHPPPMPGMQHAPRGPGHGLGLHVRLGEKCPLMAAHSALVDSVQKLLRVQHAPFGWQGELAHDALTMNWLVGGQFAAVVLEQTLVWRLQHAPVGPQLAAAQEVLAYQAPVHADLTTKEHPAPAKQHAPSGRQGLVAHEASADQELVRTQLLASTLTQPPAGLQHEPMRIALGQGPAVQEPPKYWP